MPSCRVHRCLRTRGHISTSHRIHQHPDNAARTAQPLSCALAKASQLLMLISTNCVPCARAGDKACLWWKACHVHVQEHVSMLLTLYKDVNFCAACRPVPTMLYQTSAHGRLSGYTCWMSLATSLRRTIMQTLPFPTPGAVLLDADGDIADSRIDRPQLAATCCALTLQCLTTVFAMK